jgi:hypothetical protein
MELGPGISLWKIDGLPFIGEFLSRSELCGVEYTTFIARIQYFCCDLHDFRVALKALLRREFGPHVSPRAWGRQPGRCIVASRVPSASSFWETVLLPPAVGQMLLHSLNAVGPEQGLRLRPVQDDPPLANLPREYIHLHRTGWEPPAPPTCPVPARGRLADMVSSLVYTLIHNRLKERRY